MSGRVVADLVMDSWLCGGIGVSPDVMGEYCRFPHPVRPMPQYVSRGLAFEVVPALVYAARDSGSHIGMETYKLSVNGSEHSVSATPETPLLFVLRNELKLRGVRLGCGMAQCGACAVLVDGEEVRTCITPVSLATGKHLTTVEGLPVLWGRRETLHPVQQAWIDEQVPQCGYCQSGMMIAAVHLLSKNPNPTVAQIKDAFTNTPPSPHLCRCGTYAAIIDAVRRAATVMQAANPGS
jgi:aerobic-type carbon monoxide dehydrogenase small subunit (CoxS/CutS family)